MGEAATMRRRRSLPWTWGCRRRHIDEGKVARGKCRVVVVVLDEFW